MSRIERIKDKRKRKRLVILSTVTSFAIICFVVLSLLNINRFSNSDNKVNKEVSAENNTSSKKNCLDGFLFLGDSYTEKLKDTINKNNPTAIVRSKIGVQPVYWNKNFNSLPNNKDVNGVVLLIGVNGVASSDNLPNKKKLISSLVEKYKDKTIYVQEVFPVGKNFTNADPAVFNQTIHKHNEETKKYCDQYDNVIYIDATKDLVTDDGYLKYTKDGLHIISDKQDLFYNNILDAINNS